jgi:methylated-DNA-[protein]-cysteine S-methyltransferase
MERTYYTYLDGPVGRLLLAGAENGLHLIRFPSGRGAAAPEPGWIEDAKPLDEAARQLRAYFARELREFNLALSPAGTAFQLGVWRRLREIPYGETITYAELARRIGNPKACRAVGLANGANPLPIVVPCHRVIGSNGKLTGFGGGLPVKAKLLALERPEAGLPFE